MGILRTNNSTKRGFTKSRRSFIAFIELKENDLFKDSIEPIGFKKDDFSLYIFCRNKQVKVAIKPICQELWERFRLLEKRHSILEEEVQGEVFQSLIKEIV